MSKKHKKASSKEMRRVSALVGTGLLGLATGIAIVGAPAVTRSADTEPMDLGGLLFMTLFFGVMALLLFIHASFAPALRWISGELYKGQRDQRRKEARETESAADGGDE